MNGASDMATFDEFFAEHNLTERERREPVQFLAHLRMRATLDALLPAEREQPADAVRPRHDAARLQTEQDRRRHAV